MPRGIHGNQKGRPKDLPVTEAEKVGRPHKFIDHELFERLCKIQCTLMECAAMLKVDEQQVMDFCKRRYNKTFKEAFDEFSAGGRVSMRRELYRKALSKERDSLGALVWWTKNHMGFSDKTEIKSQNLNIDMNENVKQLVEQAEKLLSDPQLKELDVKQASQGLIDSGQSSDSQTTPDQSLQKKSV